MSETAERANEMECGSRTGEAGKAYNKYIQNDYFICWRDCVETKYMNAQIVKNVKYRET